APGASQKTWRIWDARTGEAAAGLQAPEIGHCWSFDISPDGAHLAAPAPHGYVVCALKTGKVTLYWPDAPRGGQVLFAPDSRSVVLHAVTMQRYDLATGKPFYADVAAHGHTGMVRRLFFSADGARLVSMDEKTIRVWNPAHRHLERTIRLGQPYDAW